MSVIERTLGLVICYVANSDYIIRNAIASMAVIG